ncbi:sugar phosphate isomerase/epimerase [Cryobacterium frigoriphilum]|uniref:Sugar phosphate isomerase/epimerase n=1 Tax=Cryobacterium frigoriphilum TaxID=1259150 RepID=A0A4R9A1Q4_9MICO|nr:sugar phosphate isomerase/epimerase [Cryobacterium frigoriphilum]TFD50495.1 sugar phosphate isomerase/epimerase [Cryobacterium frigoriphilum]
MIRIGMSTTCVYPLPTEHAFRLAKLAGFDGLEIMVTRDEGTQDAAGLRALSERFALPILSIHAPVLLLTHFVWGLDPRVKLEKSAQLAADVGATTVVVHPPFRWQTDYAENFLDIVREISTGTGIEIAVENMFPWKIGSKTLKAYSPGWNPTTMDCDAVTLDFSHAALSGVDSLQMATALGERLRHVHLCDGSGSSDEGKIFDEHLLPGRGNEPVADVLHQLAVADWTGQIVAEVNTRKAKTEQERLDLLLETVAFARLHTTQPRSVELGLATPSRHPREDQHEPDQAERRQHPF